MNFSNFMPFCVLKKLSRLHSSRKIVILTYVNMFVTIYVLISPLCNSPSKQLYPYLLAKNTIFAVVTHVVASTIVIAV